MVNTVSWTRWRYYKPVKILTILNDYKGVKFEWYSCCQIGPILGGEGQHGEHFRGLPNYGEFNFFSYPENLTAVSWVSQLRFEPSYMCGRMLWTEIQQKMLQWSPMGNQLRVLTQFMDMNWRSLEQISVLFHLTETYKMHESRLVVFSNYICT